MRSISARNSASVGVGPDAALGFFGSDMVNGPAIGGV
jgi:hypothetical protein